MTFPLQIGKTGVLTVYLWLVLTIAFASAIELGCIRSSILLQLLVSDATARTTAAQAAVTYARLGEIIQTVLANDLFVRTLA